jgi:hypothetical protein
MQTGRIALALGIVATVLSATFAAQERAADRVPVFVKSAGNDSGFTDPSKDRQDSVKDLQRRLEKSKVVQLVPAENDAVAVIEILDRTTTRETNLWGRQNKSSLVVRLHAGDYSTEFSGESGSKGVMTGYGAAASRVADQVESWIKENRERLITARR